MQAQLSLEIHWYDLILYRSAAVENDRARVFLIYSYSSVEGGFGSEDSERSLFLLAVASANIHPS